MYDGFATVAEYQLNKFVLGGPIALPLSAKLKQARRTVADLYAIPLKPSTYYVRLIEQPTIYGDIDWDAKLNGAYAKYRERAERNAINSKPPNYYYTKLDKLRFLLRQKFIRWGVIV